MNKKSTPTRAHSGAEASVVPLQAEAMAALAQQFAVILSNLLAVLKPRIRIFGFTIPVPAFLLSVHRELRRAADAFTALAEALRQGTLPADGPSRHRAVALRPRPVAGPAPAPADIAMPALAAPERSLPQRHAVIRPGTDTPGLRPRAGQHLRPSRSASRWAFRDARQHAPSRHLQHIPGHAAPCAHPHARALGRQSAVFSNGISAGVPNCV